MREALKALEGQLVVVEGVVSKGNITQNGDRHFCVTRPRVTPWDGYSKLTASSGPPVADHLWVPCSQDSNWPKLYSKHFCVGTVGWYSRADGSVDLSVRNVARILNAERELWNIKFLLHKQGSNKANLNEAINRIEYMAAALYVHGDEINGDVRYVYSCRFNLDEIIEQLGKFKAEADSRKYSEILPALQGLQREPVPGSALLLGAMEPTKPQSALERLLGGS